LWLESEYAVRDRLRNISAQQKSGYGAAEGWRHSGGREYGRQLGFFVLPRFPSGPRIENVI
jgi:hypothetical protein